MNVIERLFNTWGKAKGQYLRGIDTAFSTTGARPLVGDRSAWIDPQHWGDALLEDKKPRTKQEFVEAFTSWVYICVKLNAQTVASVPLKLYVAKKAKGQKYSTIETRGISKVRQKHLYMNEGLDKWLTKAEEIEEVIEHPLIDLLREVNPYNNRQDLWESTSMFLDLTGECYWLLIRDRLGVPRQVWTIPSQHMTPVPGTSLDKAIDHYEYKRGKVEMSLATDEVIMFTYPNPSNLFTGYSCVRGVADAIYLQRQMYEFETSLFENRARPGGILVPRTRMSKADRERLTEQFTQKFAGAKKAGKTLIPPADMDFIRDAMTPEEISFIDGMKLYRTEIMAAFDIPEGAIITETSNRSVAEVADYRHAKNGIQPRCKRVEEKINEKLVPLFDEKLFMAFDSPVPADKEFELKKQTESVGANIMLINEVRAELGLESVPWGDTAWIDSRLIPADGKRPEEDEEEQVRNFSKKVMGNIRKLLG